MAELIVNKTIIISHLSFSVKLNILSKEIRFSCNGYLHTKEYRDNEAADKLAKEARDLNNNTTSLITLDEANAIARYRLEKKTSGG